MNKKQKTKNNKNKLVNAFDIYNRIVNRSSEWINSSRVFTIKILKCPCIGGMNVK